jgi:hypothetical protein
MVVSSGGGLEDGETPEDAAIRETERRPASSSATRDQSSSPADSPGTSRARSTTRRSGILVHTSTFEPPSSE